MFQKVTCDSTLHIVTVVVSADKPYIGFGGSVAKNERNEDSRQEWQRILFDDGQDSIKCDPVLAMCPSLKQMGPGLPSHTLLR